MTDPDIQGSRDFHRPKLSPPEIMGDSLYTTVDKKMRYPAPNIPAPPPPYEGNTLKNLSASVPERSTSPPGYEEIPGVDAIPELESVPRLPPSLPPSRPSRPPTGKSNYVLIERENQL